MRFNSPTFFLDKNLVWWGRIEFCSCSMQKHFLLFVLGEKIMAETIPVSKKLLNYTSCSSSRLYCTNNSWEPKRSKINTKTFVIILTEQFCVNLREIFSIKNSVPFIGGNSWKISERKSFAGKLQKISW